MVRPSPPGLSFLSRPPWMVLTMTNLAFRFRPPIITPSSGHTTMTTMELNPARLSRHLQGPGEANWGHTCPTVVDWNRDGLADIVMSDSTATHRSRNPIFQRSSVILSNTVYQIKTVLSTVKTLFTPPALLRMQYLHISVLLTLQTRPRTLRTA